MINYVRNGVEKAAENRRKRWVMQKQKKINK